MFIESGDYLVVSGISYVWTHAPPTGQVKQSVMSSMIELGRTIWLLSCDSIHTKEGRKEFGVLLALAPFLPQLRLYFFFRKGDRSFRFSIIGLLENTSVPKRSKLGF